jgi:ABC-2 type transport system ATP-binding protein
VDGLDLEVRSGDFYGLVGPDGAGKSTVLRLLSGILRPTGGEGRVLGFDLRTEPERIKAQIGYLSQNFTLYGDLTVDENIEFFAELHGCRDWARRRDELLAFTRLAPFRTRPAQALSGGMKKKLALACTLVHTPALLFLDEPSTGVDPVSRGEFWRILSDVRSRGVTVVMTTPYLDEASRCQRVGLLHRGRLLLSGPPDDVRAALPGSVQRLDCRSPVQACDALRRRWPPERIVLHGGRIRFWARGGDAEVGEALALLDANGFGPSSATPLAPSLEDAFVALLSEGDGR